MADTDKTAAIQDLIESELQGHTPAPSEHVLPTPVEETGQGTEGRAAFAQTVAEVTAQCLKIPFDRFDSRAPMSRFGVDSIIVTEIMKRLSDVMKISVAPTVFFEARNTQELADILHERYVAKPKALPLADTTTAAPKPETQPATGTVTARSAQAVNWISQVRAQVSEPKVVRTAVPDLAAQPEPEAVAQVSNSTDQTSSQPAAFDPVAIISMDGVFPDSGDLDAFEAHLRNGDDCISEVPADRWDWQSVYGDPREGEFTRVKYGGFAPDIDKFDPMYFGLSPREAELMDPQHRVFIQCVYRLIGKAGYATSSLSGRKIGIFLGVNLQDYAQMVDRAGAMEALHLTSLGHMFCPNRLSFYLDVHGPSQVIDTACSSSLIAVHRAVLAIQHEGCEMAIAGGANLLISPDMHIMYSKVGMICEDGRCKTFSRDANGYVRSDGVGAVLLKRLSAAERDGDTILSVIRGSAENHGGQSTSLTAPNPRAQANLIVEAHQRAASDPRAVGYIECHGTGTELGDPIEVNGLKMAFDQLFAARGLEPDGHPSCGIGSVKSNIGHAETAAGIAGLIKTVLSLRAGRRFRTLHAADQNPMVDLTGSNLFITQQDEDWPRVVLDGVEHPRRAGVSSFGAGGSNAHIVVEEYGAPALRAEPDQTPEVIVLSARTEERLGVMIDSLHRFLGSGDAAAVPLDDIAYTLQIGREAMAARLALVAVSKVELAEMLLQIAAGKTVPNAHRGTVKRRRGNPTGSFDALTTNGTDLATLAALWVQGEEVDWAALHAKAERSPRRVTLPPYPFEKRRCWLPDGIGRTPQARRDRRMGAVAAPGSNGSHNPLLGRPDDAADQTAFHVNLSGDEAFLRDHVVMGHKVLPGVAYLEIALAAVARTVDVANAVGWRVGQVVWVQPYVVEGPPRNLTVTLDPRDEGFGFKIESTSQGTDGRLHCQGSLSRIAHENAGPLEIAALKHEIATGDAARHQLSGAECYERFGTLGLRYGPSHQGLVKVYHAPKDQPPQALAQIQQPKGNDSGAFLLDPGLVDSVLQSCIGLTAGRVTDAGQAALPFGLTSLDVIAAPGKALYAWTRPAAGQSGHEKVQKYDIDVADEVGRVCLRFRGFSCRAVNDAAPTDTVVVVRPIWSEAPAAAPTYSPRACQVLLCDPAGVLDLPPGQSALRLPTHGTAQDGIAAMYLSAAQDLFRTFKSAMQNKAAGQTLVQVLVPRFGGASDTTGLFAGLSGLIQTANTEATRAKGQLIELETPLSASDLAIVLEEAARRDDGAHFRYGPAGWKKLAWHAVPKATLQNPWKENGVYLISGGGGGLARLFAHRIADKATTARLVLCARSEPDLGTAAWIHQLEANGLHVDMRRVDVTDALAVERMVTDVVRCYGRIDGVLHAAGTLRDAFIAKKEASDFASVLPPKVSGAVILDRATAMLDLDFFAMFGSASAIWGSAGQTDYAAANGFLDAFAHHRAALVDAGTRTGRSLSIDWPLWAEGGMQMAPQALAQMRMASGMGALVSAQGLDLFEAALAGDDPQRVVLVGDAARIDALLKDVPQEVAQAPDVADAPLAVDNTDGENRLFKATLDMLLHAVSDQMGFDISDLDGEGEWTDLGFDSITLTEFSNRLNDDHGLDLTPTVFFEHATVDELAGWLADEYPVLLNSSLGLEKANSEPAIVSLPRTDGVLTPDVAPTYEATVPAHSLHQTTSPHAEPIAVIGMSGRFPMAADLEAFWDNLVNGVDCISEIPADRWDWRALEGDPVSEPGKSDVKWGGFIDGIGDFDAKFFGISRREAALMDPAQRLLMEYVWRAIEDAGYAPHDLGGSDTAVIIGTAPSGYGDLVSKSGAAIDSYSSTGSVGSVGPNRISYFLDLHGPSEPVETACSSALVAVHRAITAIANGDCSQAIVGGINLILSPETHISFNRAGMLSRDGRCKTFSKQADGYVRGEGVGMLFLKRLRDAERDGDNIYGVLRGSAENHGGKANSLTAPNPKAQSALIQKAITRAGIDPRSIGYIEAHGTGTELGDPIEISGLKSAFAALSSGETQGGAYCAVGSVKTNIGHLELGAGIAGLIKVLLQMKHKTLVSSLHGQEVNPYIKLADSPFYMLPENRPWPAPQDGSGTILPRRAGVSSFGFGGVNAHVVIEEYIGSEGPAHPPADEPQLVVLSACDPEALRRAAAALSDKLRQGGTHTTSDRNDDLADRLARHVANVLDVAHDQVGVDVTFDEMGMEHVHRPMIRAAFEAETALALHPAPFMQAATVTDLAAALVDKHPELASFGANAAPGDASVRNDLALRDIAFTLQTGRDAMSHRVAIVVSDLNELLAKLALIQLGRAADNVEIHSGVVPRKKMANDADGARSSRISDRWIAERQLDRIAEAWVQGVIVDWSDLYDGPCPSRVSLPGYVFAKERIWFDTVATAVNAPTKPAKPSVQSSMLHPLLHENTSTLSDTRFRTMLTGKEFFLADHKVQGRAVLPGVAYIEMARAACLQALPAPAANVNSVFRLRDIMWVQPALVEGDTTLTLMLEPDAAQENGARFSVFSDGQDGPVVHSRGICGLMRTDAQAPLDLGALQRSLPQQRIGAQTIYPMFDAAGLEYGPGHQCIVDLQTDGEQVLAQLALPANSTSDAGAYVLHPGMMDAALQAAIGLGLAGEGAAEGLALPFAIETVTVFAPNVPKMWAWLRRQPSNTGRAALVQKLDILLCDDSGAVLTSIEGFSMRQVAKPTVPDRPAPVARPTAEMAGRKEAAVTFFSGLLARALACAPEEIETLEPLEAYGIDSHMVMELNVELEHSFGNLPKTLFFEYVTLDALIDYFIAEHGEKLDEATGFQVQTAAEPSAYSTKAAVAQTQTVPRQSKPFDRSGGGLDIAIIGLSGRYPLAPTLEEYWINLREGRDCITEIPPERWDWQEYFTTDRSRTDAHFSKWGGFIDDVDRFDPLFFNISPSAAESMDPQERVFLEHAWMAMEDAGYRREDLRTDGSDGEDGSAQVGVYVGVMYGEYQLFGLERSLTGGAGSTASYYAGIANRVSYVMDLQGPSLAVDTMCSSSLTAVHLACADLVLGRTNMAFAGGVNLNLHPNKYSLLSKGQYISGTGRCQSFGSGGDGYVPSEGVGVVVLKRLEDAVRDGDHVYGVIKGSAVNHGGRSNGYTVPNPQAHQGVIAQALRESGTDPRTIGYIEAHGTGTSLGDPIEINGLVKGYGTGFGADATCWIGSSKSNIGHGEAVSGLAGLTKVLLQMRAGQIAPSLHAEELNPNIDFDATPFRVNRTLRDWSVPVIDGQTRPRAAAVSSFGAGGSNAHLVIEQYMPAVMKPDNGSSGPHLFVLSARTEDHLKSYAGRLAQYAGRFDDDTVRLRDLAYTLQTGREAMPHRLGVVAQTVRELALALENFVHGRETAVSACRVRVKTGAALRDPTGMGPGALLDGWIAGDVFEWSRLYDGVPKPSRISLPTYPFARERYWIARDGGDSVTKAPTLRPAAPEAPEADLLQMVPVWCARPGSPSGSGDFAAHHVLFCGSGPDLDGILTRDLPEFDADRSDNRPDQVFTRQAIAVLDAVQGVLRAQPRAPVLIQVVVDPGDGSTDPLATALAGLLDTARMENPLIFGQTIILDQALSAYDPASLASLLRENARARDDFRIRYKGPDRQVLALQERPEQPNVVFPSGVWREAGTYLIVGGAGGLGLIIARHLATTLRRVKLILVGRSALDSAREKALDTLRKLGADIEYCQIDIADAPAVQRLVDEIAAQGPLHGIIHSGGVLRDGLIVRKTADDIARVFEAKVAGVVNLDHASRDLDLDIFLLFSSIAGVTGNPGQADYAAANAFLDLYADRRNAQRGGLGRPKGRAVSIAWPLWAEGGMQIAPETVQKMTEVTGLVPLSTQGGIAALEAVLAGPNDRVLVVQGQGNRMRDLFLTAAVAPHAVTKLEQVAPQGAATPMEMTGAEPELIERIEEYLTTTLAELLKIPKHRLEPDIPLIDYGIDSVAIMALTDLLRKITGDLPDTLFFEFPTIETSAAQLAAISGDAWISHFGIRSAPARPAASALSNPVPSISVPHPVKPVEAIRPFATARPAEVTQRTPPKENLEGATGDIAIIGMAGRFPMAEDVDAFWENLVSGRDCITEVPADRWNHADIYDPDTSKHGKTACKWGGFLGNVGHFDAAFFRITPDEAELLDPQERLFLENCWTLLETSGYLGERLRGKVDAQVGVFVGSMTQQYHSMSSDPLREALVSISSPSSIANRVSHFFDFHGPSLAVDTMCSSATVGVHMACESLRNGDCRMAIAGGVNTTIHPNKYLGLSAAQLIGSHPNSTSFGSGDGYLPAETVGAVLLKPLAQAELDNDNILAVIKGTGVNHSGTSSGYRVPNIAAQAELIADNFRRSGVDPRSISWVEAAANGAPMGDSIELAATAKAFARFTPDTQFCAMGSVKSNIGHAEAASGMSQIIKVVQQMRHATLVPVIKADPLNPDLNFASGPFYLQRKVEPWVRAHVSSADGTVSEVPRRAAINAIGAGGTNAHLILEEYRGASTLPAVKAEGTPVLIPISARDPEALIEVAVRLLAFVETQPALNLADLAQTLQTARTAMDQRVAFVVSGHAALVDGLCKVSRGQVPDDSFAGNIKDDTNDLRIFLAGDTGRAMLDLTLAHKDLEKLALYWVRGARIVWAKLNDGVQCRPVTLPMYPFRRHLYWLPDASGKTSGMAHATGNTDAALDSTEEDTVGLARSELDAEGHLRHFLSSAMRQPAETLDLRQSAVELGLDSIALLPLCRAMSQATGLDISVRDVLQERTLQALADGISRRGAAAVRDPVGAEQEIVPELAVQNPPDGNPLGLSEGQMALWLIDQSNPGQSSYNVPVCLGLKGPLNVALLRQACAQMLDRHPILTSVFVHDETGLHRMTQSDLVLPFDHWDLTEGAAQSDVEAHATLAEMLSAEARRPFDLGVGPLFRACVITSDPDDHVLLLCVHHSIFDGRSALVLAADILQAYKSLGAELTLPFAHDTAPYEEFVAWQQDMLSSDRGMVLKSYWRAQLKGAVQGTPLPMDRTANAKAFGPGASIGYDLDPAIADKVSARARQLGVLPSAVFLSAFVTLLNRLGGDDTQIVGIPVMGRPEARFDATIGHFVNVVPFRCVVTNDDTMTTLAPRIGLALADALDHGDLPLSTILGPDVMDRAQVRQSDAGTGLFRYIFAYQNIAMADAPEVVDDITVSRFAGVDQVGGQDLALEIYPETDGFRLRFDYDTGLFDESTVASIAALYEHLLDQMLTHSETALRQHPLVSSKDQKTLLHDWGYGGPEIEGDGILAGFDQQVVRTPEATALVFEGQNLTYQTLQDRVAQLARTLMAQAVQPGDVVACCLERGPEMVIAVLATWRAGAVHLTVSPTQATTRLAAMFEDAAPKTCLVGPETQALIAGLEHPEMALVDVFAAGTDLVMSHDFPPQDDAAVAYVIFTSGSTGRPKGVEVTHRSVAHHIRAVGQYYALTPSDVVLHFSDMTFDASFEQMLPALMTGAMVVIRPDGLWSASACRSAIETLGITVVDFPPAYLQEVLEDCKRQDAWDMLAGLRTVIVGGEAISPSCLAVWCDSPMAPVPLINIYGPSETTIASTAYRFVAQHGEPVSSIPIGRPLPGETALVLDTDGHLLPRGLPGELHIGGVGVARGYVGLPALTQERFIPNPFEEGGILYRTGDRVRWRSDGQLAFLGRIDRQVNIRGFRIECDDVEAALLSLPQIADAVVLVQGQHETSALVAFVVLADMADMADTHVPKVLNDALAEILPAYMCPSSITVVAAFPRTAGGKVDHAALRMIPAQELQTDESGTRHGPTEDILTDIWKELLQTDNLSTTSNVFDLGAHSLLLVRFVSLVQARLEIELPVSRLFAASTVRAQARLIDLMAPSPLVILRAGTKGPPLILVHAAGGTALCYRDLLAHVPEGRPVWALEAVGDQVGTSVAALAKRYVGALRAQSEGNPWHLAGWSAGGAIAWEMAQQLKDAGETVGALALIDSYTPSAVRHAEGRKGAATDAELLLAFALENGVSDPQVRLAEVGSEQPLVEVLRHLFSEVSVDHDAIAARFDSFKGLAQAVDGYTPAPYEGSVKAFYVNIAGHLDAIRDWPVTDHGTLEAVKVNADHYSILREPKVGNLANAMWRSDV